MGIGAITGRFTEEIKHTEIGLSASVKRISCCVKSGCNFEII